MSEHPQLNEYQTAAAIEGARIGNLTRDELMLELIDLQEKNAELNERNNKLSRSIWDQGHSIKDLRDEHAFLAEKIDELDKFRLTIEESKDA